MANDGINQCKDCGCKSKNNVTNDHDVHLHVEIENLKQKLVERDSHITTMETNVLNEANKFPNGELVALQEEVINWQDKYRRLYDAHRRIQRVNQGLEDKLLRLVDICETEKVALTKDIATVSHKLAEANYSIKKLTEDNERYKNDVSIAIQFLQCKQGNFVSQKLDTLPNEVQAKVSSYVMGKRKPEEKKSVPEIKNIKVPIPTFPPTAMVYSIPKYAPEEDPEDPDSPEVDIVSAAIMAKVLEERERERAMAKHCDTCTCSKTLKIIHENFTHTIGTQTQSDDTSCSNCNTFVDNEPLIKIVKQTPTGKSAKNVPMYTCDKEDNHFVSKGKSLVVKVEPNNYLNSAEILDQEETPLLENKPVVPKVQSLTAFQTDTYAKNKGPIFCSVRLQNGSKNILLDNVHNNVSPVLYTHPNNMFNSGGIIDADNHRLCGDEETNLLSAQAQDNISKWICSNSDTYNSNSLQMDPARYAEMENNVKKFLFGEGRLQNISKRELADIKGIRTCRSNSHTVTEI